MMLLSELRKMNIARCNKWQGSVNSWSLSDWGVAMAGEAGEVCDVIKKLNRVRDGLVGNGRGEAELKRDLAWELADTLIYLDLLAARAGISLEESVVEKFNMVSKRLNFSERL